MNTRLLLIAILCVAISLAGCQSMHSVDLASSESLIAKLAPNDVVRVWMRDGRKMELRLTAVEADALVSGDRRLPVKDIEKIERERVSVVRTSLLVVGIGALLFALATAAVMSASLSSL